MPISNGPNCASPPDELLSESEKLLELESELPEEYPPESEPPPPAIAYRVEVKYGKNTPSRVNIAGLAN